MLRLGRSKLKARFGKAEVKKSQARYGPAQEGTGRDEIAACRNTTLRDSIELLPKTKGVRSHRSFFGLGVFALA